MLRCAVVGAEAAAGAVVVQPTNLCALQLRQQRGLQTEMSQMPRLGSRRRRLPSWEDHRAPTSAAYDVAGSGGVRGECNERANVPGVAQTDYTTLSVATYAELQLMVPRVLGVKQQQQQLGHCGDPFAVCAVAAVAAVRTAADSRSRTVTGRVGHGFVARGY